MIQQALCNSMKYNEWKFNCFIGWLKHRETDLVYSTKDVEIDHLTYQTA